MMLKKLDDYLTKKIDGLDKHFDKIGERLSGGPDEYARFQKERAEEEAKDLLEKEAMANRPLLKKIFSLETIIILGFILFAAIMAFIQA